MGVETALILRAPTPRRDLDGYEFRGMPGKQTPLQHAVKWLSQTYVRGAGYRIEEHRRTGPVCEQCGHRKLTKKALRSWTAEAFVAEFGDGRG